MTLSTQNINTPDFSIRRESNAGQNRSELKITPIQDADEKPSLTRKVITTGLIAIATIVGIYTLYKIMQTNQPDPQQPIHCPHGQADGNFYDFDFYEEAAEEGNREAQYCFAKMHLNGENGADKSAEKAKFWLAKSGILGCKQAQEMYDDWQTQICSKLLNDRLTSDEKILAVQFCRPNQFLSLYPVDRGAGIKDPGLVNETLLIFKEQIKDNPSYYKTKWPS